MCVMSVRRYSIQSNTFHFPGKTMKARVTTAKSQRMTRTTKMTRRKRSSGQCGWNNRQRSTRRPRRPRSPRRRKYSPSQRPPPARRRRPPRTTKKLKNQRRRMMKVFSLYFSFPSIHLFFLILTYVFIIESSINSSYVKWWSGNIKIIFSVNRHIGHIIIWLKIFITLMEHFDHDLSFMLFCIPLLILKTFLHFLYKPEYVAKGDETRVGEVFWLRLYVAQSHSHW